MIFECNGREQPKMLTFWQTHGASLRREWCLAWSASTFIYATKEIFPNFAANQILTVMKKHFLFLSLLMVFAGMSVAQNNPMHGWHTYCGDDFNNAIGGPVTMIIATCYPPDMAINYAGTAITKVGIYSDTLYNAVGGLYTCSIYLGGETPTEGTIASTITVDVPQGLGDWVEFDLDTPVWVTGNLTIWIVWESIDPLTAWPMGVCSISDPSGNGNWIWNGEWTHLDYLTDGDWTVKTYFNWDEPQPQQDVYVAGNHFTTGQVFKNNTLLYNITDSIDIQLKGIKVAENGTVYGAGYAYNDTILHGCVWMNDSCIFTADTNTLFDHIALNGNDWTAAGGNNVWQNGELLYSYNHGEDECHIHDLAVDTTTGDIYVGGAIFSGENLAYATVWKNDSLLWMEDTISSVQSICFDGENLYSAGFLVENDSIFYGVIWQNDSIIYQMENANFGHIAAFDGSLYWSGIVPLTDTVVRIWQDGEVLYALPELSGISNLVVNESGVYYTDAQTVYKDGEVLYQPEECIITDLVVKPAPLPPEYTITVESANPELGNVDGGGTYSEGSTATLLAIPNIGCEFLMWNDSITDNPRNIIVTQDSTFIASFGRIEYTITVESENPDWGSVSGSGTFYYGDTIEISATPFVGYVFSKWTDQNVDNPRTVIVTENHVYSAIFERQSCTITTGVDPEGAGNVIGGGTYYYGDTITLTAHNNPGYEFVKWTDGVIDNPREVVVEGDASYKAVFSLLQYEITTASDPVEGGTVTGGGIYNYGSIATLTATANPGYIFLCWNDGGGSNPRHITVTGNATYTAMFYQNGTPTYTITVLSNNVLLGNVSGGGEYPEGATIEISAAPGPQAVFVGWDDGNTDNPRSITVTQDMTFTAIFEATQETYEIIVESSNPLLGRVYGGGTYAANVSINIGAIPNDGVYFTGWQDGNTDNPRNIIVIGDAIYTAYFAPEPVQTYTITVQYDEAQGYVLGGGNYVAGSTATLAAIANDNYYFVKWGDGNTDNPRNIIVDHDITLAAFFNGTGVNENDGTMIRLYPNPANDKIRLEGLEGETEISIYNAFGTCVKKLTVNGEQEISVGDLSAGLYFIRIDGHQTMKFVKR